MTAMEIKSRIKVTIRLLCVATLALAFIAAAGWFGGYRINMTPSYPLGFWRIEPAIREVRVGDRVFICPPDNDVFRSAKARGYMRRGLCPGGFGPLIKTVAASAGQRVDIDGSVQIDGQPLAHSQIANLDGQRRQLSQFTGGVVPQSFVFLHSDYVGSYDSRYFGPIPQSGLLGLATEVLTYAP